MEEEEESEYLLTEQELLQGMGCDMVTELGYSNNNNNNQC
jgi:hypothetical protein